MSAPDLTNGHGSGFNGGPMAPPQNLEAEQSVLGAVLLSDTALPALIIDERLSADDFYRESHGRIYQAMLDLHTQGEPIDALTLVEHLKQAGDLDAVGGAAAIELLAGSVPAVGNVRQYARIVRDNAMLRRLLHASYEIQAQVHGHEALPRDLVDMAERIILEVAHEDSRKDFHAIESLLHAELDKLQKLSLEGTPITGTPSGFEDLDNITGGFQPGNLIILAARPAMGKSALMANFAENAALTSDKAVALFSLEMSEGELAQRFIASQASIKGDDLRKGRVPQARWGKILQASSRLAQSKLFIDDSSDLSVLDVRAKARRLAQQNTDGLGLILIDYLQLMRAGGNVENRVEQIGQISRGLKTPQGLRCASAWTGDTLIHDPITGARTQIDERRRARRTLRGGVRHITWRRLQASSGARRRRTPERRANRSSGSYTRLGGELEAPPTTRCSRFRDGDVSTSSRPAQRIAVPRQLSSRSRATDDA